MKPLTFENLRRLMGGGRKKKDKESSFKRSDSFKRISIRKSYLDRGGRKKQQQKRETVVQVHPDSTKPAETDSNTKTERPVEMMNSIKEIEQPKKQQQQPQDDTIISKTAGKLKESNEGPGQSVIAYGNWLRGVRVTNDTPVTSTGIRGCERTIIYVPASDDTLPAPPVIRQLSSSPVFRKKSPIPRRKTKPASPALKRKESNDSAVEMFPWGDSGEAPNRSPLFMRRPLQTSPPPSLIPDANDEMCSLSVSLGRIWMDAPMAMAPRSLELPRPGSQSAVQAHNSLDSALKDRRENPVVSNRLQGKLAPPVARTLSSTSSATASTGLFSSKDSGFSFSLSIPKLTDFSSTTGAVPASRGFFRKKRPKPKLSVSRDGYFKRTSGALVEVRRNSVRRKSSRKKAVRGSGRRKKNKNLNKNEMYQVVVGRPPRSLRALKLDPMIFVPPEKRKPSMRRKQSFKLGVREIRDCPYKEQEEEMSPYQTVDDNSDDEGLYECISGDFDIRSDDTPMSGRVSHISNHYYDMPTNDLSKSSLSDDSPVSVVVSPVVSDDDEENTSAKSSSGSTGSCYLPAGVTPVQRKKPVRRRKSVLSQKKAISYVAKPGIMRAPSTLRRSKKKKTGKY